MMGSETLTLPPNADKMTQVNDLTNLPVGRMVFTDWDHQISGDPIRLGSGGILLDISAGGSTVFLPDITLISNQKRGESVSGAVADLVLGASVNLNGFALPLRTPLPGNPGFNLVGELAGAGTVAKVAHGEE